MSWFKNIFNKVSGMKDNTEQQEIMNKINDTYDSIAKGVEELNAKVVSVKELKVKLKNLPPPPPPPPPPEKPNEIVNSSEDEKKKKEKEEEDIRKKQKEEEDIKRKQKEEEEKNKVVPPIVPNEPGNIVTKTSSDAPLVAREASSDSSSSPLPIPGAVDATPRGDFGSLDYGGGKKRKTRAKAKRTISKNKNNSNKRTRKNKNKNKEATPSEANTETAAQVT
jgi:hypothetical protein